MQNTIKEFTEQRRRGRSRSSEFMCTTWRIRSRQIYVTKQQKSQTERSNDYVIFVTLVIEELPERRFDLICAFALSVNVRTHACPVNHCFTMGPIVHAHRIPKKCRQIWL